MHNVFYLDDEKEQLVNSLIEQLEKSGKLKISWSPPVEFENALDNIEKLPAEVKCLFFDLKLDGEQENGKKVRYQAPPLAQMIRTLATEKKVTDLPIILCSTEDKIHQSYIRDFTSHDLFDWTFIKDQIDDSTAEKVVGIIEGYEEISKHPTDFSTLIQREYSEIDERILSRFQTEEQSPTHEIARYIFKGIVKPVGIMINEPTLAARLGIDRKASAAWTEIRDAVFAESKYKGVFSGPWSRWWNDMVQDIFEKLTGNYLTSLTAEERVEALKNATGINDIVAAKPLKFFSSTLFWNVCEITQMPLDPFEGYKISPKIEPQPWQDYRYVSMIGMLERPDLEQKMGIKIYPSQLEQFQIDRRKIS